MRVLTGKLLTGKFLEIGVALCLLAARPALAADEAATRLAQNGPSATEQPVPGTTVPGSAAPGVTAGQDQGAQPGVLPPAAAAQPTKRNTAPVSEASPVSLGTPVFTAQVAGLIALGLAIMLTVTRLSVRRRSKPRS